MNANGRKLLACAIGLMGALFAFQKPFHQFPGVEYFQFETPPDWQDKSEWAFARLMFPSYRNARFERRGADWREGGTGWSEDYPRADRHFNVALRRLTRVHARSAILARSGTTPSSSRS